MLIAINLLLTLLDLHIFRYLHRRTRIQLHCIRNHRTISLANSNNSNNSNSNHSNIPSNSSQVKHLRLVYLIQHITTNSSMVLANIVLLGIHRRLRRGCWITQRSNKTQVRSCRKRLTCTRCSMQRIRIASARRRTTSSSKGNKLRI